MSNSFKILLLPHYSDQNIPLRTPVAEVFRNLSSQHSIVSFTKTKFMEEHFVWERIEINKLKLKNFLKTMLKLSKNQRFDIIFARDSFLLLIIGLFLKKKLNIPLLFQFTIPIKFITGFNHKWYHPKNIGGTILQNLLIKFMKRVDLILPISEWMGKYLIHNGLKKEKIFPLPDAANPEIFRTKEYPNILQDPIYIYVGTIDKIRKLDVLIHSMKKVCEQYKNAHLYMVGDGEDLENLKSLAKKMNLQQNITFTGFINYEDIPNYIEKAHVCICPIPPLYHYKLSSPLKLFEYMSCSRPVIANKEIPAHIRPLKESNGGLLVDYASDSFAKAMIGIIKSFEDAKNMGLRGRKWIESNRTYEILTKSLENKLKRTFFK